MKEKEIFKILILIARPAAGKSEIIDYLKRINIRERKRRFHIGDFEEIESVGSVMCLSCMGLQQ